jgi:hypothetical protein
MSLVLWSLFPGPWALIAFFAGILADILFGIIVFANAPWYSSRSSLRFYFNVFCITISVGSMLGGVVGIFGMHDGLPMPFAFGVLILGALDGLAFGFLYRRVDCAYARYAEETDDEAIKMKSTNSSSEIVRELVLILVGIPAILILFCAIFLFPFPWRFAVGGFLVIAFLVAELWILWRTRHFTMMHLAEGVGIFALFMIVGILLGRQLPQPWDLWIICETVSIAILDGIIVTIR